MSMEMDAIELHALYSPLWEKVPETRPEGVVGSARSGLYFDWMDHGGEPASAIAAVCRVAVQQSLMQVGGELSIYRRRDDTWTIRLDLSASAYLVHDGSGPTFDHALVALALAVHAATLTPTP